MLLAFGISAAIRACARSHRENAGNPRRAARCLQIFMARIECGIAMIPFNLAANDSVRSCVRAANGPDVELRATTSLGEEITGAHRVALFVRHFRRGRGNEFFKARIISKRIEHRIEPEQRRSERHAFCHCTSARYRE
jgi:hypothetical protein